MRRAGHSTGHKDRTIRRLALFIPGTLRRRRGRNRREPSFVGKISQGALGISAASCLLGEHTGPALLAQIQLRRIRVQAGTSAPRFTYDGISVSPGPQVFYFRWTGPRLPRESGVSANSFIVCFTSWPRPIQSISPKLGRAGSVRMSFHCPAISFFHVQVTRSPS